MIRKDVKKIMISASTFLFLFSFAACAPDLVVNKLTVTWDAQNKKAEAEIANIGNKSAESFAVYFKGEEDPVSQHRRPQMRLSVPSLAKGATVTLHADFVPLAYPENNNLGNVYKITALVDPRNIIKESNEKNNEKSSSPVAFKKSRFDFDVLSGNADVFGYGAQGPSGDNLVFTIDTKTGLTNFVNYKHVVFLGSHWPSSLISTTIWLINGVGTYDFTTGNFSNLRFDVKIEDANGGVTIETHNFSGRTTAPISVPVGNSLPSGVGLEIRLSTPFSINLGNARSANLEVKSTCVSAENIL